LHDFANLLALIMNVNVQQSINRKLTKSSDSKIPLMYLLELGILRSGVLMLAFWPWHRAQHKMYSAGLPSLSFSYCCLHNSIHYYCLYKLRQCRLPDYYLPYNPLDIFCTYHQIDICRPKATLWHIVAKMRYVRMALRSLQLANRKLIFHSARTWRVVTHILPSWFWLLKLTSTHSIFFLSILPRTIVDPVTLRLRIFSRSLI